MDVRSARRLCPEAVVVAPRMSAYSEASKAVYRVFDEATPLVEALDRRGVPRRSRPATARGHVERDRGATAARRARAGRPADHSRRRADEVPGQGGERRGQARRPARRAARPGARLPASAPDRAPLGRGPRDRGEAQRSRHRHRPRRRRAPGGRARVHSRARPRPATPRALTTATPPGAPAPPALDRVAISFGRRRKSAGEIDTILVGLVDRVTRRLRESRARGPHGGVAPPLRRLLTGDPVDHAAVPDRAYARSSLPRASCWSRPCR